MPHVTVVLSHLAVSVIEPYDFALTLAVATVLSFVILSIAMMSSFDVENST